MKTIKTLLTGAAASCLFIASANAAAYIKIDGIKGESKAAEEETTPRMTTTHASPADARERRATGAPRAKGGNAETTWKVEKGEK